MCVCVCVCVCVKDAFKLQVNSVTTCNCHERRWFFESSDHLGGRERTRDNLGCLTVSSRHRPLSRSGKCFGCLSCKLLHDKSHRGSGFRGERKELSLAPRIDLFVKWRPAGLTGQLFAAAARIPRDPIRSLYFGPPTVRILSFFLPVRRGGCEALREKSFWE